jgi:hypothetical protein
MRRGWEVELFNGTIMREDKYEWREIPKKDIQRLSLLFDGRRWDLVGKQAYFVRTSASMVPGVQESFTVEKRCIGFYEGAKKVIYVVDEFTGRFEMKFEG